MSTIGIDIGTTGCKAAVFNGDGAMLGYGYRGYSIQRPGPGLCELQSSEVWIQIQDAIREAARNSAEDPVEALCISSLGEAMTPVDASGRIIGNCILSSDTRGSEYSEALASVMTADEFFKINANIISPNYSMPKLAWLRDKDPTLWRGADKFLLWDGLVSRLLGGEAFASYSIASRTLLFDIRAQKWSEKLLDLCGIDPAKLPPCRPAGYLAGTVSSGMADSLGLPQGVKIVVGGHDQCLNALGAGAASPGSAVVGLGTYECVTPVFEGLAQAEGLGRLGLNLEHHVVPGLYVSFLFNQAGSLVRWFRETFARDMAGQKNPEPLLEQEMPEGPSRLAVLPYFEPSGSPGYVNDASGVILGLKMDSGRGEILKAILESTSLYFHETWLQLKKLGVKLESLTATGGGSRSDRWLQIKSDIFGVPVQRPMVTECGTLGAAILAACAEKPGDLREMAGRCVRIGRVFEPDPVRSKFYQERAEHFRSLFPAIRGSLSDWNKTAASASQLGKEPGTCAA